ncbi:pyrroline-5-carboxylate reductase family protein [Sphingomonas xanthus]|uniref:Pyrroline-5-carboxylate reductase n=1 Tax=Sphingomonas xanthus TaxID=2594473 RepID=A0A516IU06_9SPHN|nr:pyrroline-5-carboxylate reductase dimerization domain-containing protein [Sphingomonas xanthus]QDP20367.1 pyrroline-5-carboxylate reductase [Sphingomonas xanthus]
MSGGTGFPVPTWLIGCGNMAAAMVGGWKAAGLGFDAVTVVRPSGRPVEGIRTQVDYPVGDPPKLVLLGVKPQKLDEVVPALEPRTGPDTIIMSMLAGVAANSLAERFPAVRGVVRIMPNLPVQQRQGVTAVYGADAATVREVLPLIELLGMAPVCAEERELSVIGAVAAAGPAYVARFAAAMGLGGAGLGLDPQLAAQVAVQTLIGTAALADDTGESMADIARRVASPAGTTEQGLAVLDGPDGLQPLVDRMLAAAVRRGEELADAARRN